MAEVIRTLGPYAAVFAAFITAVTLSIQWRLARRAQQQDRKQELFAAAYEACIEYAEMAYSVRRRRADSAAEERLRLSEQLREIQIKLARYQAWVRFESSKVGAVYSELVALTRDVAGISIKEAWREAAAETDASMVISRSVVDLGALDGPRERYMAAVEEHLRPRR